jgi:hypothetical protein
MLNSVTDYLISDVVFYGTCAVEGSGGAISLNGNDLAFVLSQCAFHGCSCSQDGGAIWMWGRYAQLVGFAGFDCSAEWQPFVDISTIVPAGKDDSISVTESLGFAGLAARGGNPFCLGSRGLSGDDWGDHWGDVTLTMLNVTRCVVQASSTSGLTLRKHHVHSVLYSQFDWNTGGSVLTIGQSDLRVLRPVFSSMATPSGPLP